MNDDTDNNNNNNIDEVVQLVYCSTRTMIFIL
jgi:hypothetical protein